MTGPPLPWQTEPWRQLAQLRADDRLPHALLVTAPAGTGLSEFVEHWARAHLCADTSGDTGSCGQCRVCQQIEAGTCPDLTRLVPEEAGRAIGVDAVRNLIERLNLTAGPRGKVAVIDPADAMTLAAANSLLKTLEEPPGDSVIALVSCRPSRLPATVRSRCRRVGFGLPERETALAWLRERAIDRPEYWLERAGGAPVDARHRADAEADEESLVDGLLHTLDKGTVSPALVTRAGQQPLEASLSVFTSVVADLLRLRVGGTGSGRLQHPVHAERMAAVAARLDARELFHYLDELNHAVPGPSSSLRPDMQIQGLLADAAALRRINEGQGGR